jgi:hypothetical protein
MPLLLSKQIGNQPLTTTQLFDLGVADGTNVASLNLLYSVSTAPQLSQPITGTVGTFP